MIDSTAKFDSPAFAEQWVKLSLLQQHAAARDAYEAYDTWERDPDFEFPKANLFALPIEERERVMTRTHAERIAHHNRTGFVVPATDSRGRNGWFPIGQVSTVVGFSGMGKTKLVLQLLEATRTETLFLSDRAVPKNPCCGSNKTEASNSCMTPTRISVTLVSLGFRAYRL